MAIDYQGLVTQGLARQISEKIRDAILEGRIQVHERLPTGRNLRQVPTYRVPRFAKR